MGLIIYQITHSTQKSRNSKNELFLSWEKVKSHIKLPRNIIRKSALNFLYVRNVMTSNWSGRNNPESAKSWLLKWNQLLFLCFQLTIWIFIFSQIFWDLFIVLYTIFICITNTVHVQQKFYCILLLSCHKMNSTWI